jgi:PPOX class probable F420-dependent enzyme
MDARRRAFMAACRTATLATTSEAGQPRLLPICFVVTEGAGDSPETVIWSPLDDKPKREADVRRLARVRDIETHPEVSLLFERWSEDWSRLAWLRVGGRAALVETQDDAAGHRHAVAALRAKYPQYRTHAIDVRPMLRIVVTQLAFWSATPRGEAAPWRPWP